MDVHVKLKLLGASRWVITLVAMVLFHVEVNNVGVGLQPRLGGIPLVANRTNPGFLCSWLSGIAINEYHANKLCGRLVERVSVRSRTQTFQNYTSNWQQPKKRRRPKKRKKESETEVYSTTLVEGEPEPGVGPWKIASYSAQKMRNEDKPESHWGLRSDQQHFAPSCCC